MKIRYQADADLNQIIVRATLRREPGIDFRTATAGQLSGLKDYNVLARAAGEGRILVTHDRKTMPRHFAEFILSETSSGVLIVPQKLRVAPVVEDLLLVWTATEAEEWVNQILVLPR